MIGLSICIPVHNFNCIASVIELCKQIENLTIKAEVLVIDDASDIDLPELVDFKNTKYLYKKLDHNVGRAKIRNVLAQEAKFDYLLFIDGDSGIMENFLELYVSSILKYPNHVIYGGTIHQDLSSKTNKLRYRYSEKFEYQVCSKRNLTPYKAFKTNNFVSPAKILKTVPFNENITKYGHEDSFFSFELKINQINITHIKNPVIHLESDTNLDYIQKTKYALDNLIFLETQYPHFTKHNKLLQIVNSSKLFKIKIVKKASLYLSRIFENITIKTNSTSTFQAFKFFYLISIKNECIK